MAVQRWSENTLVVRLSDDPELSEDMAEIAATLRNVCCDVVLDLADLRLLRSSGISKLLRLRKKINEHQKRLMLCSLQDSVWGIFLATGLDRVFEFADNVTEALARLQKA